MHADRCGNTRRQKCCAKGSGNYLKYKSLCVEIQRMWKMKCMFVPIIIGATGIVTRSLKKLGNYNRKIFYRFTTKDCYNWNITHNI